MIIAMTGPTLTQMRQALGTDKPITFGVGFHALTVTINAMLNVTSWDLPIIMPHDQAPGYMTWLVGCDKVIELKADTATIDRVDAPENPEEDLTPSSNFSVLAVTNAAGKIVVSVIVTGTDEDDTTLAYGQLCLAAFGRAVGNSLPR